MRAWLLVVCIGCNYQPVSIGSDSQDLADARRDDASGDADVTGDSPIDIDAPPTLPVLLQEQGTVAQTGASLAIALPALPQAGHVLVMIGAANAGALTSVTGGGATWTRATRSLSHANIEVWYGTTDGSSASVAVNRTGNTSKIWLAISEWSGLASPAVLDGATSTSGTNGTAGAGPITTAQRDLVIFATTDDNSGAFGNPSQGPWTGPFALASGGVIRQSAWFKVGLAGSFSSQVSDSGNDWEAAIVGFQIAP